MNIRHEEVKYQNPFLCLKIWELGRTASGTSDPHPTPKAPPKPSMKLSTKHSAEPPISWHYHKEVELLLILEGELEVLIPEDSWHIGQGDVIILGSLQLHSTKKLCNDLRYIVFQLDLESYFDQTVVMHWKHFNERIRPLTALNAILLNNEQAKQQISAAIKTIYEEVNRKEKGYELSVSLLIKSIFLTLVRHDDKDLLEYSRADQIEELEPALLYIEKNLTEKLSAALASRIVNLSYHHFLRRFHKAIGMTFTQYVNYKRIKRSEQLLLTEDLSIEEIAYTVGIPNRAHFYEMFQRHHNCSPKQFQLQMKQG